MEEQITWENYMGTRQPKTITVYPFTAEIVNDLVFDNIPHGNYRIYRRYIENKIGFVSPARRYEAPTVVRPPQM